jgi:hypothetical protein
MVQEPKVSSLHSQQPACGCVTNIEFYGEELLARTKPPSWRTTHCRPSTTACAIYSQLPSINSNNYTCQHISQRDVNVLVWRIVKVSQWQMKHVVCFNYVVATQGVQQYGNPRSATVYWLHVGGKRLEVNRLWWGETDVSEVRPLQAYCSSPGDCDVDHGMMVLTGAISLLVYQSILAVLSAETFLERVGEWTKEMRI